MPMLKVGLAQQSTHTRYAPTAMIQPTYLTPTRSSTRRLNGAITA
jgi:hypothetical protein